MRTSGPCRDRGNIMQALLCLDISSVFPDKADGETVKEDLGSSLHTGTLCIRCLGAGDRSECRLHEKDEAAPRGTASCYLMNLCF